VGVTVADANVLVQDAPADPGHHGFVTVALFESGDNGAAYEVEVGGVTASVEINPASNEIRLRIGPTATPAADRNTLTLVSDGSLSIGSPATSFINIGADGSTSIGSGGFITYLYGTLSFGGAPTPELPATPLPQDIADVLVALGLVTQAAP
jgi:hypothetical protein